ncbi:MAG: 2-oxoacid:acceptor oxidoreductase subunit alpha [Acidobacteriia bacterium]|nr:2-oxoacid:acceptor oxidoreductase subunit alpha [Terriglobia bacterium]
MSNATLTARVADAEIGRRPEEIVNDFSIQVATVNGSGSQSANSVLMRSIFLMGVPVSGKNIFPSNIAGLPTWFTIRANKDGYTARRKEVDICIAMNPETAREDVLKARPGAAIIYEESFNLSSLRSDVFFYPVPFAKLAAQATTEPKLRKLLVNMIYVGVASHLLGVGRDEVVAAIQKQFKSKAKAVDLNIKAVDLGIDYARAQLLKKDPFQIQRMNKTADKIIIDGNSAAALGAMFGGCTVVTWYPITPSSSLCETMIEYFSQYRIDPKTGKATFAIVQAEDELAALGMVIGAGWAGARAMTATSGPGLSLMAEFAGLAYFTEIPAVVWDIQRVGPSTGLPTRTSQGDVTAAFYLSHGDTKHIILLPGSVKECFEFAGAALDLAERFQTIVFVLSDLDLGMNNWMSDRFDYPRKPLDRGKVLSKEDLERLGKFERYLDVDGDGIPFRTLPGTPHPLAAYFTRGSGHNERAGYSERPEDYQNLVDRLARKHETAKQFIPKPVIDIQPQASVGIIAYGTTDWAILESRDQLRNEKKIETSYLRLRSLPFTGDVAEFVTRHERVYVVEQNRDGQLADLIRLEVGPHSPRIRKVLHYSGLPIDARTVTEMIAAAETAARKEQ